MNKPFEIVVGGTGPYDPAAGTTDCNIAILRGVVLWIEKIGYGTYDYSRYTALSTGGFRLTDTTFSVGERYYVHHTGIAYGENYGSYSNGFNLSQVISALFGRVGWKQSSITGSPAINATNTLSKSGRYFNDGSFHSLVTVANITKTMEEVAASEASLNAYLEQLQRSIIIRSLTGVFNPPEYVSQTLLYTRYGGNDEVQPNEGKFVGVRVKVPPTVDLATQIDSVSLYFDKTCSFNLVFYCDTVKAPIAVIPVNAIAYTQTQVTIPDMVLSHVSQNYHGGIFYVGYYQSELAAQGAHAINELERRFTHGHPFGYDYIQSNVVTPGPDFNRREVSCSNRTFGLNLHVSVFRDHTWQITKKVALFDNLVGLQMAAQIVEQIVFNIRSNGSERLLKDQVATLMTQMELSGSAPISESPQTVGLRQMIEQETRRIKESFFPSSEAMSVSLC
jgi:hypothetical protein